MLYTMNKHKNEAVALTQPPQQAVSVQYFIVLKVALKASIHWARLLSDLKLHLWQLGRYCHKSVPLFAWLETIYQVIILNYGI